MRIVETKTGKLLGCVVGSEDWDVKQACDRLAYDWCSQYEGEMDFDGILPGEPLPEYDRITFGGSYAHGCLVPGTGATYLYSDLHLEKDMTPVEVYIKTLTLTRLPFMTKPHIMRRVYGEKPSGDYETITISNEEYQYLIQLGEIHFE